MAAPRDYPAGFPKSVRELSILFVPLVLILAGMAIWEYSQRAGLPGELLRLEHADPIADCNKAVEAGDYRFVGISGYGLNVPGAKRGVDISKYGCRAIPGTNDVIQSNEHLRLQEVASEYAMLYNEHLVHLIKEMEGRKHQE